MKNILIMLFVGLATTAYAQDKHNYVQYNQFTKLEGTNYVLASYKNVGKMGVNSAHLLFINMKDGSSAQTDFADDANIEHIQHIKVDSVGVNCLVVNARTVNLDGSKTIDWDDPTQVFIFSPDGKRKVQVTPNDYYTSATHIDREAGSMIVAGYHDTNHNGKLDKTDRNEIIVYDLKEMKLLSTIGSPEFAAQGSE